MKPYRILLSLSVLLLAAVCVCLCLSLYLPGKTAPGTEETVQLSLPVYSDDPALSQDTELLASCTTQLEINEALVETLRAGILNCEANISIAQYNVPYTAQGIAVLQNSMGVLIYLDADIFFIDANNYNIGTSNGIITSVVPTYLYVDNELAAARNDLKNRLNAILNLMDPGFSDLEKALFLHDYLAEHFEYDQTLENHNPYIMLTSGTGVCQAYTALYAELLSRCGISSTYVINNAINHIWNGVLIGGQAYHVDVTWDDAVGKADGKVGHYFFLLSDDGMKSQNAPQSHGSSWGSAYSFQNTAYDTVFFKTTYSAFQYVAPNWYVIDENMYIQKCSSVLTDPQTVLQIYNSYWKKYGTASYYQGPFTGLGRNGNLLYYNTPDKILSFDPDAGTATTILNYTDGGGYVYGSHVSDSVLYYTVGTTPDPADAVGTYMLPLTLDDTTWQNQYQFDKDDVTHRITLTKYKGSATTITVPAYAVIDGTYYRTVLGPAPKSLDSIWYGVKSSLQSLTFEPGVIASADMSHQFYQYTVLSSLDVAGLITSDVQSITNMFQYCSALTELDLSTWDLSGLTQENVASAFLGCTLLDVIRTPNELNATVSLPFSDYREYNPSTGKFVSDKYESLPTGQNASKLLKRDKRKEPNVTLSNVTKTYDGKQIAVPNCTTASDGKKTYKYYSDIELQNSISRPKAAGTYYAVVTVAETDTYLAGVSNVATLTISKKSLTISIRSFTKTYGQEDPALSGTVTGLVSGETMPVTYTRDPGESVGTYKIRANYTATDNYEVKEVGGTLTIQAQSLTAATLTLLQTRFTYDRTGHEPGTTVTLNDQPLTAGIDYTVSYTDNVNAGTAKATVTGTGNYSGTLYKYFVIEKALVTIRADNLEKLVGDPDPVLTGTVTGLCEGDDLHVTYSRTAGEAVGSYPITPAYSDDTGNYKVAKYNGSLVIHTPEAVSIVGAAVTLDRTSFVYSGAEQKPTVTVVLNDSTLTEGTDYQLSYSDAVHAGTVTLTVTGINSYQGLIYKTYTIGKAEFRITVRDAEKIYGDPDPEFSADPEGLCEGDTFTCDFIRSPGSHVGKYPITANVQISSDYLVVSTSGLLTIQPAELVVTTDSAERIYDGEPLTASGHVEGLRNGETATLQMTGSRTDVGSSDNTFQLLFDGTAVQTDYTVRSELGTLTVLPLPETESETESETEKPEEPDTGTETNEPETTPWNRETGSSGTEIEPDTKQPDGTPETEEKVKDIFSRALGCGSALSPSSGILLTLVLALSAGLVLASGKRSKR